MPRQFRPSVCPSVTRVICIKTAERIIEIVSPSDRPIIYVAAKATYIRLLFGKRGFFGPSSVKRGRTHIVLG